MTFGKLERGFPLVCARLIENNFAKWTDDLDFLLAYMQMIRARSPLFFAQKEAEGRALRGVTVTGAGTNDQITVDSLELRPLPETFIRNRIIVHMREEIEKGASWLANFHWCLRYTDSPLDPVITSKQPVYSSGRIPTLRVLWSIPTH